jgi:hypothetical protein
MDKEEQELLEDGLEIMRLGSHIEHTTTRISGSAVGKLDNIEEIITELKVDVEKFRGLVYMYKELDSVKTIYIGAITSLCTCLSVLERKEEFKEVLDDYHKGMPFINN